MFKSADPTRRVPTYLQANTKENLVWQLKLSLVLFGVIGVIEAVDQYRFNKKYKHLCKPKKS